jgi:hypothetical protein
MVMNHRTFDRTSLPLSATLLGQLLYIVVTQFHADGDANKHPAVFAEYAGSRIWTAVHLGQFAGMVILLAGLLYCSSPWTFRLERRDGQVDSVPLRRWRRWRCKASSKRWTESPSSRP